MSFISKIRIKMVGLTQSIDSFLFVSKKKSKAIAWDYPSGLSKFCFHLGQNEKGRTHSHRWLVLMSGTDLHRWHVFKRKKHWLFVSVLLLLKCQKRREWAESTDAHHSRLVSRSCLQRFRFYTIEGHISTQIIHWHLQKQTVVRCKRTLYIIFCEMDSWGKII